MQIAKSGIEALTVLERRGMTILIAGEVTRFLNCHSAPDGVIELPLITRLDPIGWKSNSDSFMALTRTAPPGTDGAGVKRRGVPGQVSLARSTAAISSALRRNTSSLYFVMSTYSTFLNIFSDC